MIPWLWHHFLHYSGSDNVSGAWYGFWSGFGGDLAIFAGLYHYVRKYNCHVKRCWRVQFHTTAEGWHVCKKHHPTGPPTHKDVQS